MSGQTDYETAKGKVVTTGGYAALGSGVRLRISDGIRFVFGLPDQAVAAGGLTRDGDDLVLTTSPVCSGDAGAAVLHSAWLVGSAGAVCTLITQDMRYPIIAGNGNEVTLDGLRWTLPA